MPVQKTLSNGTRYDLIKDTPPPSSSTALWTDTIASGIRLQCCTTTASASSQSEHEPHLMNIHKNPINTLLQQSKQPQLNPYATTGIFQHNHSPLQTTSTLLPTYVSLLFSPDRFVLLRKQFSPNRCVHHHYNHIIYYWINNNKQMLYNINHHGSIIHHPHFSIVLNHIHLIIILIVYIVHHNLILIHHHQYVQQQHVRCIIFNIKLIVQI